MTEDDVRALLHEMRDEPVPADSLARVRMAVADRRRIEKASPWLAWSWKWLGLIGTAVAVAVLAILLRPAHHSTPTTAAVRNDSVIVPAPPPAVSSPQHKHDAVKVSTKIRQKVPRVKDAPAGNLLVRIETADPDVVILLVGDGD
jgi:anti-sigma factor RsiW